MENSEIIEAIRAKLSEKKEFIGHLKLYTSPIYRLQIFLANDFVPVTISYDGTDEQFLNHCIKEIENRRLHSTKFYSTNNRVFTYEII